jgi:hypothetical protein
MKARDLAKAPSIFTKGLFVSSFQFFYENYYKKAAKGYAHLVMELLYMSSYLKKKLKIKRLDKTFAKDESFKNDLTLIYISIP